LACLQSERDQTNQLLHERTAELTSAQAFLGTADATSVADVLRTVDLLNAETSQAAISITDLLSYRSLAGGDATDSEELNRAFTKLKPFIGQRICELLTRRLAQSNAEFDPMITQLALQAGLTCACARIINDWNPPTWDDSSTVTRVYSAMRAAEGQVIAGRWRALAHTYMNNVNTKEEIQKANAKHLRAVLRDLLAIVGWSSRDPEKSLPSEYKEKIRILSDKAVQIQETIGRGITSMDLKVQIITCDSPFDPTRMDDADGQRGKQDTAPSDTVACTIELGLVYGKSVKGNREEVGIILKPKVLLVSVLEEGEKDAPEARA